ncbi:MAG TPA: helix-turn-helix domain-containing protein [Candidatus Mediterraneibacter gallistercoris]|uniref:Helix-turn-helix domain-containing protein n=1 Tax=Candidatus Mediterraneibacter gallistercoris TaxID=2838671 RepID=A0A9D2P4J2_9FIRM|nr:helix-turn-helix domain-containing protein [Candidatus Mediterraneibacter gallistercoris]
MSVGGNIRKARKVLGITQKELGEKLGISQAAIGQLENDRSNPKMETLRKISKALDVSISELINVEEGTDINIVDPDIEQLREEYSALRFSLNKEDLQIMIKIAYAFIGSHGKNT